MASIACAWSSSSPWPAMHSSSERSSDTSMAMACHTAGDCSSDFTLSAVTVYASISTTKKDARMA
jgi:hypothetical protein